MQSLIKHAALALLIAVSSLSTACGGIANGDSSATFCAPSDMGDEYVASLVQAVDEWTERAGTTLHVEQGDCSSAGHLVWTVRVSNTLHCDNVGPVYATTDATHEGNFVTFSTLRTPEQVRTDLLHEIGHTLGLPHLSQQTAIMYADDMGQQHLTDDDLRAYEQVSGKGDL